MRSYVRIALYKSTILLIDITFNMLIKAVTERAKRYVFSWVRIIPLVKKKVEEETMKARVMMEEDMNKCTKSLSVYSQLPQNGRSVDEVAKEARDYLELGI